MIYVKGKLFTYVALYFAVLFLGVQLLFSAMKAQTAYELPLLLLLLMNELGMFMCLFGVWAGVETLVKQGVRTVVLLATVACAAFAVLFLYLGIQYWPEGIEVF